METNGGEFVSYLDQWCRRGYTGVYAVYPKNTFWRCVYPKKKMRLYAAVRGYTQGPESPLLAVWRAFWAIVALSRPTKAGGEEGGEAQWRQKVERGRLFMK